MREENAHGGYTKGTDMDEVHYNAERVLFFFQDKDGYVCYQ